MTKFDYENPRHTQLVARWFIQNGQPEEAERVLADEMDPLRWISEAGQWVWMDRFSQMENKEAEAKNVKAHNSPYLTSHEAVEYLRLSSVKALYSLKDRGLIHPLPGHRRYRLTKEELDRYLRGGKDRDKK